MIRVPRTDDPHRGYTGAEEERGITGSAGGVERLPIEVQAVAPPSDGMPTEAFMQAATPVNEPPAEPPSGES